MKVGDVITVLGKDTRFTLARESDAGLFPVITDKMGRPYQSAIGCVFTKDDIPKDIFRRYLFFNVKEMRIGEINGEETLILRLF